MAEGNSNQRSTRRINRLIAVVVQVQDASKVVGALRKLGLVTTELPSIGAFLTRHNTTLLIGLNESQEEAVVETIHAKCRQRIEYVSTPLEGAPLPLPVATPVTVGGATMFAFEVERYEEF
ncbi:MAG TPA: cyclic-di-AMP receptor [Anaerolineales bacterium]|nr:cyclic-di-AMP receptor [Anaerolineales bacterium]